MKKKITFIKVCCLKINVWHGVSLTNNVSNSVVIPKKIRCVWFRIQSPPSKSSEIPQRLIFFSDETVRTSSHAWQSPLCWGPGSVYSDNAEAHTLYSYFYTTITRHTNMGIYIYIWNVHPYFWSVVTQRWEKLWLGPQNSSFQVWMCVMVWVWTKSLAPSST